MTEKKVRSRDLCGGEPSSLFCSEVDALKSLVERLHPLSVVVQIGAGSGLSTLAMLEDRIDLSIISIDIQPCEAEFELLRKAGLDTSSVVRILGRSQEVGKRWRFPVDMVFIDGDHRADGVSGDILVWRNVIKPGGIMAFHDYIPGPLPEGIKSEVASVVNVLMRDYEQILYVERIKAFWI